MTTRSFPTICLVTDRHRLFNPSDDELARLAGSAAAAGVDLIHVRERNRTDKDLLELTRRIVAQTRNTPAAVVVNDRVDVAMAADSAGVHLRADSIGTDRVRAISPPGFLIGRSVHTVAEAQRAAESGVDYIVMGSVYPTKSKDGSASVAGLGALQAVCATVSVPVLAIGGITTENVSGVASAGASGIAAIGLFSDIFNAHRHGGLDESLATLVAAIRRAFAPFSAASPSG